MTGSRATSSLPALEIVGRPAIGDAPGPSLQQWLDGAGHLVASGGRAGPDWWMHWPGLATYYFGADGPVRAVPCAPGLDATIADSFVRGVTPVVMIARGAEGFHGSAVSGDHGVAVFCAPSGTGKSTTALALAATGLAHWADDSVIYRPIAGGATALRLPCPVRVDPEARSVLGSASIESDAASERPLHRIYLLERQPSAVPGRPSFTLLPPRARFDRLLAHAHPFDLDGAPRRRRFIEALLAVAGSVEVFECGFAPSLDALPALARTIRAHLEAA